MILYFVTCSIRLYMFLEFVTLYSGTPIIQSIGTGGGLDNLCLRKTEDKAYISKTGEHKVFI